MELGQDFTMKFTMEGNSFTNDIYESLRIWPQTRICYAVMQDDTLKVLPLEVIKIKNQIEPQLIPWMVELKWQHINEDDNGQ